MGAREPERGPSVRALISKWSGLAYLRRKLGEWTGSTRPAPKRPHLGPREAAPRPVAPQAPILQCGAAQRVREAAEQLEQRSFEVLVERLVEQALRAQAHQQYFFRADARRPGAYQAFAEPRFALGRVIGAGSFSTVRLAHDLRRGGAPVAVKLVRVADVRRNRRLQTTLALELGIAARTHHPHIVRFEALFVTREHICIVMEHVAGGELFKAVSDLGAGLDEPVARALLGQLLSAVLSLHDAGIVHRDLKLENVLLDTEGPDGTPRIKLIDFGLARFQAAEQALLTRCGSEEYASPEVILGRPYDGRRADAWSFGVIMYACLFGTLPFNPNAATGRGVAAAIIEGRFWLDEAAVSPDAVAILRGLLVVDATQRTALADLRHHPYFR